MNFRKQLPLGRFVILSGAGSAQSAFPPQSKDPVPARTDIRLGNAFFYGLQILVFLILLAVFSSAQTLTGTVKNSTTSKPAAGDEVVLLKLSQGMEEAGRTKTDAKGNFSFKLDDTQSPHLVRAIHEGVTYHRMAPPGTTSVEVQVYDVGKKIDGITNVADIMRFQAGEGQLEVQRVFAVQNSSQPPRTQMNERNLEFYVPDGAKIVEGSAMTAGGQPVNSAPVPEGDKNRYSFVFPLRPGETRFQVVYQVPYTGNANIDPKPADALQHFVVVVPKTMQFTPSPGAPYQQLTDPQQPGVVMEVASNTTAVQPLSFRIAGEGAFPDATENGGSPGQGQPEAGSGQSANRPGGGLGPPIDAPDPLQKYRWYILGGFGVALIAGAVFVASRQQLATRAAIRSKSARPVRDTDDNEYADDDANYPLAQIPSHQIPSAKPPSGASKPVLLEALKEEIFDLEVEHKQGHISEEEYEKAKAALDQTLERALKRAAQKKA
ncbi:MAG TPA: carboxypeptidase regulatory-like domain-containing protein [Candidatus Sulfotelmatobacter sp.]